MKLKNHIDRIKNKSGLKIDLWESSSGLVIDWAALGTGVGFLRQEHVVNVGPNATVCDGHRPKTLTQFLIVPHRQLNMTWHYACLLVVSRCIPSQFQNLKKNENSLHKTSF